MSDVSNCIELIVTYVPIFVTLTILLKRVKFSKNKPRTNKTINLVSCPICGYKVERNLPYGKETIKTKIKCPALCGYLKIGFFFDYTSDLSNLNKILIRRNAKFKNKTWTWDPVYHLNFLNFT